MDSGRQFNWTQRQRFSLRDTEIIGATSICTLEPVGLEESKRKFGWARTVFAGFAGQ